MQNMEYSRGNYSATRRLSVWRNSWVYKYCDMGRFRKDAATKIAAYFKLFNWQIVEVLESKIVTLEGLYENEEFQDMVERASTNKKSILCGTFRSYKVN